MSTKDEAGVEIIDQEGSDLDAGVKKEGEGSELPEDNTDYKSLYEKEVEISNNYKTALKQKRQLRNKDEELEEDEQDDEAPVTLGTLKKVIQDTVLPSITTNREQSILEQRITNPEKRKLVKFYLDNRIVRTGTSDDSISNDIDTALAIADSKKIKIENEELKRANANKGQTVRTTGSGQGGGEMEVPTHKFSKEQEQALTAKAKTLGIDPKIYIAKAWKNTQGR